MRKSFKTLAALVVCAVMCLSLAACGGNDGPTLESYIESIQSQLDAQIKQYEEQGMKMEVKAEGNKLVYIYQYTTDLGADNATLKTALDGELEKVSATFSGVLSALKTEVPSAEAVVVRYLDVNGAEITSQEWK